MTALTGWEGTAYNQATTSENRIHSDEVARKYGFRGGLVPGITVYAYLVQPAVVAWGREWLERGSARVLLKKPLYDGARFRVDVKADGSHEFHATVLDGEEVGCAEGGAALPEELPIPPEFRGDPPIRAREQRPAATRAALEELRDRGLGALHLTWPGGATHDRYTRSLAEMPELLRVDRTGLAHPAFTLGLANTILSSNVHLGPWIHTQSDVQHFAAIPPSSSLSVEARVADLFERGGHEFVDLDVAVFLEGEIPALRARHRAIYELRPA